MKLPGLGVGYLPTSYWLEKIQRSPKQHELLPLILVVHQNSMLRPHCWRQNTLCDEEENSGCNRQETLLPAGYLMGGRAQHISGLHQHWTPNVPKWTCQARCDQGALVALRLWGWVITFWLDPRPAHRKEFWTGTINLVKSQRLERLEEPGRNLLLLFH